MKTPPFLIAAVLLFWGWQSGQIVLSVLMAVFLEGSRLVKSRYNFSPSDFNRISDLCVVIFLGMTGYFFVIHKPVQAFFLTIQWLPLPFIPLAFSQCYSTTDRINISGFFLMLRRRHPQGRPSGPFINLSYPYFALCILSTSVANISNHTFYFGLALLSAWALWTVRTVKFSITIWIILLSLAMIAGYLGHIGLHNLHLLVERKGAQWVADFSLADRDPFRSATAIGDMGRLKQSDRILLRVKQKSVEKRPLLLREASYNIYRNSVWMVKHARFKPVKPAQARNAWILTHRPGPYDRITVTTYLNEGKGLLTLPLGTVKISQLPVSSIQVNQLGAVKVVGTPGFITYKSDYRANTSSDDPPNADDLFVPKKEKAAIRQLIRTWKLEKISSKDIIGNLLILFEQEFKYSLLLHRAPSGLTPLSNFLLHTRSGHCEYFATATVLLLREMGIPARYANGFSVQEFDRSEKGFIVRARHAHAWALAYIDGVWQNVDTTPPAWFDIEAENATLWEPLMDLWFFGKLKFSEWRSRTKDSRSYSKYILLLFVPVIAFLVRILLTRKKTGHKKETDDTPKSKVPISKGLDSPFFLVEKKINESGFFRNQSETFMHFINRLEADQTFPAASTKPLFDLLKLHYRFRFDPLGINADEKLEFKTHVQKWIAQQIEPENKKNSAPHGLSIK